MSKIQSQTDERQDKNLVSPKLSTLLKMVGFNKPCLNFLDTEMLLDWQSAYPVNHNLSSREISQPTKYQVLDWLRESCGIYLSVLPSLDEEVFNLDVITIDKRERFTSTFRCNDYESALEESLLWILENIFTNQ